MVWNPRPAASHDLAKPATGPVALHRSADTPLARDPTEPRDFSGRGKREEQAATAAIGDSELSHRREILAAAHAVTAIESFGKRQARHVTSEFDAARCGCPLRPRTWVRSVARSAEPLGREGVRTRNRSARIGRNREALAPARTPGGKHFAAALGLHAGTKPVSLLLVAVVGTERALHRGGTSSASEDGKRRRSLCEASPPRQGKGATPPPRSPYEMAAPAEPASTGGLPVPILDPTDPCRGPGIFNPAGLPEP
jgi:hypothetical protein